MCGIAGMIGPGVEQQHELLGRLSIAIVHRGPDDTGQWIGEDVALTHRRLSIIDLSTAARQPMRSDCGRYVIVFNGEIYNYLELREELERSGVAFHSRSDTEVLMAAFREWGPGCLHRLNGMWAFAIWDNHDRALFACRDRLGKKPFYYLEQAGRLYFASEIKALRLIPGFSLEPNPAAVADFCAERVSDHSCETFLKGIRQLSPGHFLRWRDGHLQTSRYWRLELHSHPESDIRVIEELGPLLESAIQLRLRSDVPVGALLSGGLDSTLIAAMAHRQLSPGQNLHVFVTRNDPPEQEAEGVDALHREHPDLVLHEDCPTRQDFWNELPKVLWHQEEPFADASMVAHFRLMRLARQNGVPVLLTGQGADEIFAGYPGYLWVYLGSRLRLGELTEFVRFLRLASRRQPVVWSTVLLHALPAPLAAVLKRAQARIPLDWLTPDYRCTSPHILYDDRSSPVADPLDQVLHRSITTRTLPGFLHYEDRNSMAFGVETRLPFLDFRLVEALFTVPARSKLDGGVTKSLLRKLATGIVPDLVSARIAKTGYPAPLETWLRSLGREVEDVAWQGLPHCPMLEAQAWSRKFKRFLAGDSRQLAAVWRGLILLLWYRQLSERFSPS